MEKNYKMKIMMKIKTRFTYDHKRKKIYLKKLEYHNS